MSPGGGGDKTPPFPETLTALGKFLNISELQFLGAWVLSGKTQ